LLSKRKIPSTLGREGNSRGTTQFDLSVRSIPIKIGLPNNAGNAVRTNVQVHLYAHLQFTRKAQEGTSAGCHRMQVSILACISLSAFADLLSSVKASIKIGSPVGLYYPQKRKAVKGG
jgi:hypothetical protein